MRFLWSVIFVFTILMCSSVHAADNPFKTYNPDVDKYAFTKDFIISLSYYDRVARRLQGEVDIQAKSEQDPTVIKTFIDDRTLDNAELRIARNYLTKFSSSKNGLIQKVVRDATATYDSLIEMSAKERTLWQGLYQYKTTGEPHDFDEPAFVNRQLELLQEKKEISKGILQVSALLRTVVLSAAHCDDQECKTLALSQKEREKLILKLDAFAKENMDWGAKPGQTMIQACVATIREVLEDSLYQSSGR